MPSRCDAASHVRSGEELDVSRLEPLLLDRLPGTVGPLRVEQFPRGFSNLTYLLKLGEQEFVLRKPPFGNPVRSAHDMRREYQVLSGLAGVYAPAPRPLFLCEDVAVLGDEFYVMERRRGVVLRSGATPDPLASDPTTVRRLCEAFIDNLADLHSLDYGAAGLAQLGKPEGYVRRQVDGWIKRYRAARTDDVPDVERVAAWLSAERPADSGAALIHNDYKYDNLLLDRDDFTRIVAVLDWEMATIGDPLMDLGSTLAYWVEATDAPEVVASAFGPTALPGSMTRRELVARYSEATGRAVPHVRFYHCFGLFKLIGIVQQIYARYVRGHTTDDRFAHLNKTVRVLGVAAAAAMEE